MACVLVLAPHPDDEVLGCGGAIARHAAAGDDVHVVVVTRGSPEFCTSAMIEENRMELAAAHAILGVQSVRFLDFPRTEAWIHRSVSACRLNSESDYRDRSVNDLLSTPRGSSRRS